MKKVIVFLVLAGMVLGAATFFLSDSIVKLPLISPKSEKRPKPLEKYTFEQLKNTEFAPSEIQISELVKDEQEFGSHIFYFKEAGKKVSGLINIPKEEGKYPVIIMLRGYVDRGVYTTGEGTRRTGEVFAKNDFITLAPDFLGYGQSDNPSANPIEERFQTYTTVLTLLKSIEQLNSSLSSLENNSARADPQKIGIWGHSNGGQIALSVLSVTGRDYPTVLWNPVSKPFPYSILYFTDDFEDHGKAIRKVVSEFEKDYDIELYSPTNYYHLVTAPIQLHQAGQDEAVPQKWSDQLYDILKEKEVDIEYFVYPFENHNFTQGSWDLAVERSIEFFNRYLLE